LDYENGAKIQGHALLSKRHIHYKGYVNKDFTKCSNDEAPRHITRSNKVSIKILEYFSIIPSFKHIFVVQKLQLAKVECHQSLSKWFDKFGCR